MQDSPGPVPAGYRVLYEISGDVVSIGHIARGTAGG
ncbi:MAG: hypothetical protein QOG28_3042 [Trebonia sp.]|jgi:hypothetical protein|nr:hypothetical protein [Actinomycetes bacterium]MDX6418422.1 hypothetical protein [Trebonia sp.]